MAKKASENSKLVVAEKANKPLAKNLSKLIGKDVAKMAEHLGCSPQAINQYKMGTSVPQLEKLVKIAQYYNVSTDYLLGLSDVKTTDPKIKEICEYTGLSEEAAAMLHRFSNRFPAITNSVLENLNFWALIGRIEQYREFAKDAYPVELWLNKGEYAKMRENSSANSIKERDLCLFQIQELIKEVAKDGANNG